PPPPPVPYTTLFRSLRRGAAAAAAGLRPDPAQPQDPARLLGHHRAALRDPGPQRAGDLPRADRLGQLEPLQRRPVPAPVLRAPADRKSTRLNSSHVK